MNSAPMAAPSTALSESERPWNAYFSDEERMVFAEAGYGGQIGLGEHPAMLLIDFNYAFCGAERMPLREAIRRSHNCCGAGAWDAIEATARVLSRARTLGMPIVHVTGLDTPPANEAGLGRWRDTNRLELDDMSPTRSAIVAPLAPLDNEGVIRRSKPSAFFGSELASWLIDLHVDSLLVCGGTTSGCVRASVTDAFSLNFRTILIEDGVFDRSPTSHWVSLFDMDQKYADVMTSEELLARPPFAG